MERSAVMPTKEGEGREGSTLPDGFHERHASHFDLLRVFLDHEMLDRAYAEAIRWRYLFDESGDSMVVF